VKASVARRQKSKIPPSLMDDEQSQALCFFVSSWVLFPRDPQTDRGVTEILPLFFADLRPGTPLSLSLAATSSFVFDAWEHGVRHETRQMQSAYGKAVSAMRLALQDPNECCSDETLMAVLLLGFYEVTQPFHLISLLFWEPPRPTPVVANTEQAAVHAFQAKVSPVRHFLGAAAMIDQRKGTHDRGEVSKRLQQAVRSHIVSQLQQHSLAQKANVCRFFERFISVAPSIRGGKSGKNVMTCRRIQRHFSTRYL